MPTYWKPKTSSKTLKAGEMLRIDSGHYSDYGVMAMLRVLREFDPATEMAPFSRWRTYQGPRGGEEYLEFHPEEYIDHLLSSELCEKIEFSLIELGWGGDLDEDSKLDNEVITEAVRIPDPPPLWIQGLGISTHHEMRCDEKWVDQRRCVECDAPATYRDTHKARLLCAKHAAEVKENL